MWHVEWRRTQEHRVRGYRVLRPVVQWTFLVLVLTIGAQFTLSVWQLERGLEPTFGRPAGVEAFLPISALISFKYWLLTGYWHSAITTAEYRAHIAHLSRPAYMHNRGSVPDYEWGELGIHDPARPTRSIPPGRTR